MSKYLSNGDYELIKAVIVSNTANPVELDISSALVDMIVYESIYSATMSGNISFIDTNNLLQEYALGNGERVEIEWFTSGADDAIIKVQGEVYKSSGPERLNEHSSGVTLHFASPELIKNRRTKLFTGHVETCAQIVDRVLQKIARTKEPKKLLSSPTRNIEHIVFTGHSPIEAMKLCASRAVSTTGRYGFLFFENNQNFRFSPLEELYNQEPVTEFTHKNSGVFEDVKKRTEESFNAYQELSIETPCSFADNMKTGQYGSTWSFLSLIDKELRVFEHDVKSKFDKNKSLAKSPTKVDKVISKDYQDKVVLSYSLEREDNDICTLNNRMLLLQSESYIVNISTYGNSNLKVGDVCVANIPSYSSDSFSGEEMDLVTGKFLIAEIKHVIGAKGYNQRIKLIKDAFEETLS